MKLKKLILILIILLGIYLRVNDLNKPSIYGDEYVYLVSVQLSCDHPWFIHSVFKNHVWFFDHPFLGEYIYELTCIIPSLEFMRLLSIMFSIFSVILIYYFGKQYNESVGLVSAFLLSTSIVFIAHNRLAYMDSFMIFFLILSPYFFIKKQEKLAWITVGIGCATKYTLVILLPLFIIMYLIERKFNLKKLFHMFGLFSLSFFIVNIAAFLLWDNLSPTKGLFIKIPMVLKTFLHYARRTPQTPISFLSLITGYPKLFVYQTGFILPLFLIGFILMKFKRIKKYRKISTFIRKNTHLIFLVLWLFSALFLATLIGRGGFNTGYILPILPSFYLLVSICIYELIKINLKTKILTVILFIFFVIILFYNIATVNPYYIMFGYKQGLGIDKLDNSLFAKEATDYINNNSKINDKIYVQTFPPFPGSRYKEAGPHDLWIHRNFTTDITDADYVLLSYRFIEDNPQNETVEYIKNNMVVEKTFEFRGNPILWIYKNKNKL